MKPEGAIDIIKDYIMIPDERQWVLYRYTAVNKRNGTKGDDWKFVGNYQTLSQVFLKVIDSETKGCTSIEGIVKKIEELEKYFKSKLEAQL